MILQQLNVTKLVFSRKKMSCEALREAVCDGNLEEVTRLIDQEYLSVDYVDADDGWPLILWAVKSNHPECLRFLLERGAQIHVGDSVGNTALHKAAYLGREECVKILVEFGAQIHARNLTNQTPLELAEIFDRKDMVDLLTKLNNTTKSHVSSTKLNQEENNNKDTTK
jgi:ankyrin repeat protein